MRTRTASRGRLAGLTAAVGLTTALLLMVPAQAAPPLPLAPGIPPLGANNWSCKPKPGKFPVVLVHGTLADMTISWQLIAPVLEADGYCVFALDYGSRGRGPIDASAHELAAFVDRVLAATHAVKVSMVGHSQGGMLPRYYMRFAGGAAKVQAVIGLAPSNHGTTTPLAATLAPACVACGEQVAGSPLMQRLNAGGDTMPGVAYTVIETKHDEVVTPYTSALLTGPGVTNVVLQDRCPADVSEHVGIIYDLVALQWIENALAHGGQADPAFVPSCGVTIATPFT